MFLNTSGPEVAQVTNVLDRWGGAPTCGSVSDDEKPQRWYIMVYIPRKKQTKHN